MSSEPCKATVLSQIAFSHALFMLHWLVDSAEVVGMCDRKDLEAGHSSEAGPAPGSSVGCPRFVFCLVGLVGLLVAWLLGSLPGWLMLVVLFALFACLATCLVFFKRQVDTKRPI